MRTMTVSERSPTNSGELGWEMGQQIISNEDHDCFGKLTNQFASEGSPIFYQIFGSIFSRTNRFCFENDYFLIHGLRKCEGVGEDSRHGDGT